jgi:hypothetical protein
VKYKWQILAKRIVRTLTTESSGGNHFPYGKELLNPRKSPQFPKTNHLSFAEPVCFGWPLVELPADPTKPIVRESAVEPRRNNPLLRNESPHLPRPLLSLDGRGAR